MSAYGSLFGVIANAEAVVSVVNRHQTLSVYVKMPKIHRWGIESEIHKEAFILNADDCFGCYLPSKMCKHLSIDWHVITMLIFVWAGGTLILHPVG